MVKGIDKKLFDNWSILVRLKAHGRCEYCGSTNTVQAHHIMPREHRGTSWLVENGVALCMRHHIYWAHKNAIAFTGWIIKHRGKEQIEILEWKANSVCKWVASEKDFLLQDLKKQIKEIEDERAGKKGK